MAHGSKRCCKQVTYPNNLDQQMSFSWLVIFRFWNLSSKVAKWVWGWNPCCGEICFVDGLRLRDINEALAIGLSKSISRSLLWLRERHFFSGQPNRLTCEAANDGCPFDPFWFEPFFVLGSQGTLGSSKGLRRIRVIKRSPTSMLGSAASTPTRRNTLAFLFFEFNSILKSKV